MVDPAEDIEVGVSVHGYATCADVVQAVLDAPALPDPFPSGGRCPSGRVCLDGKVY